MSGLSVRGLTVLRNRRTVLEDVSLSAQAGAVTALLGPAGAGKTSLLAAIAGLLPSERGAVLLDGTDISRLSPRRRPIALLPPGTSLPATRTTQAALRHIGPPNGLIAALGLEALAPRPTATLSHGEALLALSAARLLPPGTALLVDEAGIGLDDEGQHRLAHHVHAQAAAGRTVLIATRSPSVALAADHLVLLAEGRLVQSGTPASLYAEPASPLAARLTGPANVFQGRIRELRQGGFVWAAGGRFVQATEPDMPRPALGGEVTLCLRPERIALLAPDETAENMVEAEVLDIRSAGGLLHVQVRAPMGDLLAAVPSWRPTVYPVPSKIIRLAWAPDAAWLLPS